jgi:hypothetical protein
MEAQKSYMQAHFARLENTELQRLVLGDQITDAARVLALAELQARGAALTLDTNEVSHATSDDVDLGPFETLRQFLDPTEAHMVAARLQASGVPAFVADANLVQANMLLGIALGGVRLQVPAGLITEAKNILAAYERGEFSLDDESRRTGDTEDESRRTGDTEDETK